MRALAALVLLLLAGPVAATQPGWPALHDVTGVAADDVLNVRAAPGASAEIIGAFDPDQTDIEVIRPNDAETWGQVNVAEGVGWVSLSFLERQPDQFIGSYPRLGFCFGAEPFWDLQLGPDTYAFNTPDATQTILSPNRLQPVNRLDHFGLSFTSDLGPVRGVIHREMCSDGMSDFEFGLSVDLIIGDDRMLSGCCGLNSSN